MISQTSNWGVNGFLPIHTPNPPTNETAHEFAAGYLMVSGMVVVYP